MAGRLITEIETKARDGEPYTPRERARIRAECGYLTRLCKEAVDVLASAAGAFERLRAWRAATAKEQGVPAYVVFHDATLRQIATEEPATLAALGTISGVGAAKLERYGESLLAALHA